jgi:hypothetical protein
MLLTIPFFLSELNDMKARLNAEELKRISQSLASLQNKPTVAVADFFVEGLGNRHQRFLEADVAAFTATYQVVAQEAFQVTTHLALFGGDLHRPAWQLKKLGKELHLYKCSVMMQAPALASFCTRQVPPSTDYLAAALFRYEALFLLSHLLDTLDFISNALSQSSDKSDDAAGVRFSRCLELNTKFQFGNKAIRAYSLSRDNWRFVFYNGDPLLEKQFPAPPPELPDAATIIQLSPDHARAVKQQRTF